MYNLKCTLVVVTLLGFLLSLSSPQNMREGSCPPALPVDACEGKCDMDEDCGGNKLCCVTPCGGTVCTDPVTKINNPEFSLSLSQYMREGSCPPALPVDACEGECGTDEDCGGNQLCCVTTCGGTVCSDPVTKRNNTELVKEGNCPEFPKGPWVCSHTCTSDSDCFGKRKCCPNRCEALTCQRPT